MPNRCRNLARTVVLLLAPALPAPSAALDLELVASGFSAPLFVGAPAGDPRLFVVEQGGRIQVVSSGVTTTFLDISTSVNFTGERGLIGLAFDPGYAANRRFYVAYSDLASTDTVVARYEASPGDPNRADPLSRQVVLTIPQSPARTNHKAGWLGFRPGEPDYLYIASGDGGSANDPDNLAQNRNSNLGKILRVDVNGDAFPGDDARNYAIPDGNPFAGVDGNDEIWAYGLRNPFRNSFDRATGDFYIADVGQSTREEINFEAAPGVAGRNYGWRALEGSGDNPGVSDPAPPDATGPIFDYATGSLGRTVIGGYVYRGGLEPGLDGTYFFGDHVSGRIFSFRYVGGAVTDFQEIDSPFGTFSLTSFGEDGFGGLYVTGLSGDVYLIAAAVPEPSTYAMLAAGLALLWVGARRRR